MYNKGTKSGKEAPYELHIPNREKKVEIDVLLKQGQSMTKVASILRVSYSKMSKYKAGVYKKRKTDIMERYPMFLDYLYIRYDRITY